ncbi:hypothetical protein SPRG_12274 [Saprolegnia parasitica CBS 223.65]|uniref:LNR domain-containing protein n=1 Tax=Saprolegnia parasitica (strain CBS 223.65) TaxID=695850 RepID=A0A067C0M1_SAPPC|nr:hypothetical protein SPRG_12274 [Saprolegnia parasitica CBS 223.65]KDO22645.1 hypothetical protein SPRG_12274 [Saprolegnia parasitica CBS 223.65]|eukprot:XP_012206653.1 hypothetical protein SPRG_12274 [Saprolegnia parasitica CBS 223.65]
MRRVFVAVALLKHVASCVYLLLLGLIMLFAKPSDQVKFQVYAMTSLSAPLYLSFAFTHLLGAISLFVPIRCRRSLTPMRWRSLSVPSRVVQLGNVVETTVQLLQAWRLSKYTVDVDVCVAYALLVSLAAVSTPWPARSDAARLVNSLTSFGLSTGFYLVVVVPALLVAKFVDPRVGYSSNWTVRYTLLTRFLAPNSALDLLEKVILFSASLWNVRQLVDPMTLMRSSVVAPTAMTSRAIGPLVASFERLAPSKPARYIVWRLWVKRGLVLYSFSIGLVSAIAGLSVMMAPPHCPPECGMVATPWWTNSCTCALLRIECNDTNVAYTTNLFSPEQLGSMLFYVQWVRCPLRNGLNFSSLSQFPQLYGVTVQSAQIMTNWSLPPNTAWPPNLLSLNFYDTPFMDIPPALTVLPTYCQTLTLSQSLTTSTLPPTRPSSWANLAALLLHDNQLQEWPNWIHELRALERLDVSSNQFNSIPENELLALPALSRLQMAQNRVPTLPYALLAAKPALVLDLSNNPIDKVTSDVVAARIAARQVLVDGSPFCLAGGDGCAAVCAPTCSNLARGNNVCERSCYNRECAFDAGDCAANGTQW